jgi:hypothetical protein
MKHGVTVGNLGSQRDFLFWTKRREEKRREMLQVCTPSMINIQIFYKSVIPVSFQTKGDIFIMKEKVNVLFKKNTERIFENGYLKLST